jgi:PAS domain S-box-containing protein
VKKAYDYISLIILCLGLGVSTFVYIELQSIEETQVADRFKRESLAPIHDVQQLVASHLVGIEGIAALFNASEKVDRQEFTTATGMFLDKIQGILAMAYVPIVAHEQRTKYEHLARARGMDHFQFTSFQWNGELLRAPQKEFYYPAYYVEPYITNSALIGFDLSSNKEYLSILQRARDTGQMVASIPIQFPSDLKKGAIAVAVPLFKRGGLTYSIERRREAIYGYVVGFFDTFRMFSQVASNLPLMEIKIYDISDRLNTRPVFPQDFQRVLSFDKLQTALHQNYKIFDSKTINIGDRKWLVVAVPLPGFVEEYSAHYSLISFIGGLLLTLVLSTTSYFQSRKHHEIQKVVDKRTLELRQTTERIRERQMLLDNILLNVPYGVSWKTSDLQYLGCNNVFAALVGLNSPSDIVGLADNELGWTDDYAAWLSGLDRSALEHGSAKLNKEYKYVQEDGPPKTFLVSAVPLKNRHGVVEGLLGMYVDISERKEAEEQQRQLEAQLLQSQRLESIGQLAAGVAHEINTPTQFVGDNLRFLNDAIQDLSSIIESFQIAANPDLSVEQKLQAVAEASACAEGMDAEYLLDEAPRAVVEALEGIERVSTIVRSMKAFSHPESDSMKSVDLNAALETTITVSRNEWKYVAEIEKEFDASLPMVPCFIGEINQAVLNIIVNAAHAIGDAVKEDETRKGLIRLSTTSDSTHAQISIADNGLGIPKDAQKNIFNPFFTTKDIGQGTGQGLAIAHNVIVKKHRGELYFNTTEGEGTEFIIRLPLKGDTRI